jgi:hypothetical protein
MSKSHASLMNRDGLLNEWSVYHFHLGEGPDRRDPNYIERTGPVGFCAGDRRYVPGNQRVPAWSME